MSRIGSLFSGYGGLDLAVMDVIPGSSVAWHVEFDKAPAAILAHHWPEVPNHHDVTSVDWSTVEPVDIITGGFPCQDLSHAGKRAGLRPGTRSGLWSHMAYAVSVIHPRLVVIENVLGILSARAAGDVEPCALCLGDDAADAVRALGAVCADLATLGYDARWTTLRAADAGACHGRARVFIIAEPADAFSGGRDGRASEPLGGTVARTATAGNRQDIDADAGSERRDGSGGLGREVGARSGRAEPEGFAEPALDLLPTPDASAHKYRLGGGLNSRGVWRPERDAASSLLPTPTAQDAANTAGPSQWMRNSLPLNTLAVTFTEDTP